MYWTFILLALCGALYRIVTVGDDNAWWLLIVVLGAALLVDLNREYRAWTKSREWGWFPDKNSGNRDE